MSQLLQQCGILNLEETNYHLILFSPPPPLFSSLFYIPGYFSLEKLILIRNQIPNKQKWVVGPRHLLEHLLFSTIFKGTTCTWMLPRPELKSSDWICNVIWCDASVPILSTILVLLAALFRYIKLFKNSTSHWIGIHSLVFTIKP